MRFTIKTAITYIAHIQAIRIPIVYRLKSVQALEMKFVAPIPEQIATTSKGVIPFKWSNLSFQNLSLCPLDTLQVFRGIQTKLR